MKSTRVIEIFGRFVETIELVWIKIDIIKISGFLLVFRALRCFGVIRKDRRGR